MKKLLLIAFTAISFSFNTDSKTVKTVENTQFTEFCRGWEAGYKNGYCEKKIGWCSPVVPWCPLPAFGRDGYQDGYHRGYLRGLSDAK